ncbi:hypothetical protein VNI00_007236 [Paramarasmius palmivorus]|uniref:HMG box domain-containing protein n=1 Tax=Paramarasmius palmivorus TaxID=297713 RepID=A0AAW0D3U9_9AGAR
MKRSPDTARYRSNIQIDSQMSSLSKVAGAIWQSMSEEEKGPWRLKADIEKQLHREKYPDYVYQPKARKGSSKGIAPALLSLHEDVSRLGSPGSSTGTDHSENAGNIIDIPDHSAVSSNGARIASHNISRENQLLPTPQDSEVPHYAMSLPLYDGSWGLTPSNWSCHNNYTSRIEPNDNLAMNFVSGSSLGSTNVHPSQLSLYGSYYRDACAYDNSPYGNVNTQPDSGVGEFLGTLPPSAVDEWWDEVLGH